jgi:hypothetical protein
MEYIIARLEAGRDAAALRRHRGLHTGKSAKGWDAKPRELSERTLALRGWDSDRDTALAVYTRLVFPDRHWVPELDGYAEPTIESVIAERHAAESAALLATF